ncbi:MAG: sulfite exporter TauE/SafE family protein [Hyphomonas sp.]
MFGIAASDLQLLELVGVLMLAGLVAGFLAGLFGIGGGFVVVPALLGVFTYFDVSRDIIPHVAIGTSLASIIVTSMRSVYAHNQHGAVDFGVIRDWTPWLVLGVGGGIFLAQFLDGRSLKWTFSAGVFLLGLHFILPVLKNVKVSDVMPAGIALAFIATFLGGFSALLGIGGGTIAILTMTMCGRTIHQAIATAAGFGVIIAVPGAVGFALLGLNEPNLPAGSIGYVNIIAVLAITTMSFLTAPLGARAAHALDASALKRVFGVYLVITSGMVLWHSFS